jgi:hypothetical protein
LVTAAENGVKFDSKVQVETIVWGDRRQEIGKAGYQKIRKWREMGQRCCYKGIRLKKSENG